MCYGIDVCNNLNLIYILHNPFTFTYNGKLNIYKREIQNLNASINCSRN